MRKRKTAASAFLIMMICLFTATIARPGEDQSVKLLIKELKDERPDVRRKTVNMLMEIGDTGVVKLIIPLLKDPDWGVRSASVMALEKLDPKWREDTTAKEIIAYYIKQLKEGESPQRCSATDMLNIIADASAVETLIEVIDENNIESCIMNNAIKALGRIGDSRATVTLINLLEEDDQWVRYNVIEALGNIKDKTAVEPLVNILDNGLGIEREKAAEALGNIKDKTAVEPLLNALNDANTIVRIKAVYALGNIKDSSVVEPLIKALRYENKDVILSIIDTLGMIGDKQAVKTLFDSLKFGDEAQRKKAIGALGEIKDPSSVDPLTDALNNANYQNLFTDIIFVLIKIDSGRAVKTLLDLLEKESDVKKVIVIKALEEVGDAKAVRPLIRSVSDSNIYVRRAAVEALIKLTGVDLGSDQDKWLEWWKEKSAKSK